MYLKQWVVVVAIAMLLFAGIAVQGQQLMQRGSGDVNVTVSVPEMIQVEVNSHEQVNLTTHWTFHEEYSFADERLENVLVSGTYEATGNSGLGHLRVKTNRPSWTMNVRVEDGEFIELGGRLALELTDDEGTKSEAVLGSASPTAQVASYSVNRGVTRFNAIYQAIAPIHAPNLAARDFALKLTYTVLAY